MPTPAIAIFTFKSLDRIIGDGGTSSWALNRLHARAFPFVVCTRNANNPAVEGPEEHSSAFVVGRIEDIVRSEEPHCEDRWLIKFSEYAEVSIPGAWKGWRNPVKYSTLEELGIDLTALTFQPMPEPSPIPPDQIEAVEEIEQTEDAPFTLTIARAKEGLANAFGVAAEAVEITIRG